MPSSPYSHILYVPGASALAVGTRARVPDRLVRHIGGCFEEVRWCLREELGSMLDSSTSAYVLEEFTFEWLVGIV